MAIRYVQRKDGTFAGSIGSGKEQIPTPALSSPLNVPRDDQPPTEDPVRKAWAAFALAPQSQGSASGNVDLAVFRINDSHPIPQANSLAKVAATVDAIEGGANTDDAVAHAIGVTPRQGAYYANAAGYLGLVASKAGATPREWDLTEAGAQFLNADSETRATVLRHLLSEIPEVDSSLHDGTEVEELLTEKLGETTALRRAATLESWLNVLTDASHAQSQLALETDGVRDRIDEARTVALQARDAARKRQSTQRPTSVCQDCFMALPATGICSCCAD